MWTNDFVVQQSPRMIFDAYRSSRTTESRASRVMDGVIHFKLKAYDTNGVWQTDNLTNNYNSATDIQFYQNGHSPVHDRGAGRSRTVFLLQQRRSGVCGI
jgi:hypothetical protein